MAAHKHPWEYKQPIIKAVAGKDEFEKLIDIIKEREKKEKSDCFVRDNDGKTKMGYRYTYINGIPHKFKNGKYTPLTKM